MSVAQHSPHLPAAPVAARRLGAVLLAALALVAALVTVGAVLAWAWVAAASGLVVLVATTTAFWAVLDPATD